MGKPSIITYLLERTVLVEVKIYLLFSKLIMRQIQCKNIVANFLLILALPTLLKSNFQMEPVCVQLVKNTTFL